MFTLALLSLGLAQTPAPAPPTNNCLLAENQPSYFGMNPGCANTGTCVRYDWDTAPNSQVQNGQCSCCDPYNSQSFCAGYQNTGWIFGAFSGIGCVDYTHYLYATVSYILHVDTWAPSGPGWQGRANEIECRVGGGTTGVPAGNPPDAAQWHPNPDMTPIVRAVINAASDDATLAAASYESYQGKIVASRATEDVEHCRICNPICTIFVNSVAQSFGPEDAGGHLMLSYSSDMNTYYSHSCAKANDTMPATTGAAVTEPGCALNTDKGRGAYFYWERGTKGGDSATKNGEVLLTKASSPTATPVGTTSYPATGLGWTNQIAVEKVHLTNVVVGGSITGTLPLPTLSPTSAPSPSPSAPSNSCFNSGYTHQISSLQFKGISEDAATGCRHGLETGWPGGQGCNSPYVICLPQENTPNVGFPLPLGGVDPYKSSTHSYTLDECKTECAYDQRCTGFEFEGLNSGITGKCTLIDDIPVEIGTTAMSSVASESDLLALTDWSTSALSGGVICYEKDIGTAVGQQCHPYFTAADLSDVMMNCYCPNNRKGFYTKKVTRTVASTTFCGQETNNEVSLRIQEAQANRMFHLCENWCLFNTQHPRIESWYYDPWQTCWREQYAGVGMHRSYCFRVIRDPYTIEQFFIDRRSANMCSSNDSSGKTNSDQPTQAPVAAGSSSWYLAPETDSCDDACDAQGLKCDGNLIATYVGNGPNAKTTGEFDAAFNAAGATCSSYQQGNEGWALPAYHSSGVCYTRHEDTTATPCNLAVGVGYQRLCACY